MSVDHGAFGTLCYPSGASRTPPPYSCPDTPLLALPADLRPITKPPHHETLNISGSKITVSRRNTRLGATTTEIAFEPLNSAKRYDKRQKM